MYDYTRISCEDHSFMSAEAATVFVGFITWPTKKFYFTNFAHLLTVRDVVDNECYDVTINNDVTPELSGEC